MGEKSRGFPSLVLSVVLPRAPSLVAVEDELRGSLSSPFPVPAPAGTATADGFDWPHPEKRGGVVANNKKTITT